MRKLAPAFILTSIVALSGGTAFAFGDMNKSKKTTSADTVSTQAAAPKASDETTKPTNPAQPNPAMPASTDSTAASGSVAATNGSSTAMSDACKGLTPGDAAWKANKCGTDGDSATAPPTEGKRTDSLGGAGSSGPAK
jgi:hypothetical protein